MECGAIAPLWNAVEPRGWVVRDGTTTALRAPPKRCYRTALRMGPSWFLPRRTFSRRLDFARPHRDNADQRSYHDERGRVKCDGVSAVHLAE